MPNVTNESASMRLTPKQELAIGRLTTAAENAGVCEVKVAANSDLFKSVDEAENFCLCLSIRAENLSVILVAYSSAEEEMMRFMNGNNFGF